MAHATSVSLSKFTASVEAAVKAAVSNHPKFKIDPPNAVTVSYLIRGIPVIDSILKAATVSETQAFANDVAAGIARAHPEVFGASGAHGQGALISLDGILVVGIPPVLRPMEIGK